VKLFVEVPTWLGDTVMASGAIYKLIEHYKPKDITIFGSLVSTQLFKDEYKTIVDDRSHRIKQLYKLPKADIAVSFRSSFYSKIMVNLIAQKGYIFPKNLQGHQVEKYSNYINNIINKQEIYPPKLHFTPIKYPKPTLGINPGATYGSAKRWYSKEFAKVANTLGAKYDIIIFGGPGEEDMARDIEKDLTIKNYKNLCGKMTIKELCEHMGGLNLFITNDSGPMHIAGAYKVPTVAIFGPTNYKETSQWQNPNFFVISKDLECAPCMKRECPLKHHKCMKSIKAKDVISLIEDRLSIDK